MTVLFQTNTVNYTGNGSTTNFPFSFPVLDASHLVVERLVIATEEIDKTYNTSEYTVSGIGDGDGGSLTLLGTPLSSSYKIIITRIVPYIQELDVNNQGGFYPDNVERALDLMEMQIQQIASGTDEGGGGSPGSPGAPGGNVMSVGLFTDLSSTEVDLGTDIIQTSGHTFPGLGHALYIADPDVDIAYAVAYPLAAVITANSRGFRLSPYQQINPLMFGAVGDDTTDDLPAFNAMRDYSRKCSAFSTSFNRPGPPIYIPTPPVAYKLSDTWNIHHCVYIFGDGCSQGAGSLCRMVNPNKHCVVFHERRTTDDDGGGAGDSGLGDASGSLMQGVSWWGPNAGSVSGPYSQGDSPAGSGVRIRAVGVTLRDCFFAFNGEDGINIVATSGTLGANQGNANGYKIEDCQVNYNGRYGCLIAGSDANNGRTSGLSMIQNGAGGLMDYSFLGSSEHSSAHTRDNCVSDPTGCNNPVSTCKYLGVYYYVVAGQHVAASTTTPGTDSSVWRVWSGHPSCITWVSGMTWATGSPYGTNPANSNARNVFTACYGEASQPPIQAYAPNVFTGGLLDELGFDISATANWNRGTADGGTATSSFTSVGLSRNVKFGSHSGDELEYFIAGSPPTDYRRKFINDGKTLIWQAANSLTFEQTGFTGDTSPFGEHYRYFARLAVGMPGGNPAQGIILQSINNLAGFMSIMNAVAVKAGWRWLYAVPVAGGKEGVLCITDGLVGSTAVLKEFGAIDA